MAKILSNLTDVSKFETPTTEDLEDWVLAGISTNLGQYFFLKFGYSIVVAIMYQILKKF